MVTFFACLALLIIGFFTYGKIVESVFRPDERLTPCTAHPDGVDYVPMKPWRAFLIQLLNIAGLGPIFGALSGAIWGPVVYLWIVLGTFLRPGSPRLSVRHAFGAQQRRQHFRNRRNLSGTVHENLDARLFRHSAAGCRRRLHGRACRPSGPG